MFRHLLIGERLLCTLARGRGRGSGYDVHSLAAQRRQEGGGGAV